MCCLYILVILFSLKRSIGPIRVLPINEFVVEIVQLIAIILRVVNLSGSGSLPPKPPWLHEHPPDRSIMPSQFIALRYVTSSGMDWSE